MISEGFWIVPEGLSAWAGEHRHCALVQKRDVMARLQHCLLFTLLLNLPLRQ